MRDFGYLRDPLFLTGCAAYAVNRWVLKPQVHLGFLHSYFNDLWLIPCALPPILWLHRRLGLRRHDTPPGVSEIASHLVFWSVLFEWVGPRWVGHATGDPGDVLAYTLGAILSGLFWWR
ncbi:MAG: hypothetical protein JNN07_16880 [Verrucomicrobiales bacterium]|nr:hypothetical protein [Verrucomicrobiales bacterium]